MHFEPVTPSLFQLNQSNVTDRGTFDFWMPSSLDLVTDALISVCLALKCNPHVRYESNSTLCRRLAANVTVGCCLTC